MLIGNFETMKHKIILGAITGAIAEAYYKEIPEHIVTGVLKRLPDGAMLIKLLIPKPAFRTLQTT